MFCPRCRTTYPGQSVCPADGTRLLASRDADPTVERGLFEALRADPTDEATREVYADCLEQHGDTTRATFLRLDVIDPPLDEARLRELAEPADTAWRAVVSRAPIAKCVTFAFACPKRWDAIEPTAVDGVRHCATCARPVYFCATVEEARARGVERACVAIDAALTRDVALAAYEEDQMIWMGEVAVEEPAPIIEQPPGSPLLARLRAKFGGRPD